MAKTILIPTDLQVGSLNVLRSLLAEGGPEETDVILMHAMFPPDGISDLLFYSPKRTLESLMEPRFREAMAVLRNRFEQKLRRLEVVSFHGRTRSAFEQFAQARHVEEVHTCASYTLKLHDRAFDPTDLIRKSGLRVVDHGAVPAMVGTEQLVMADGLQLLFER